MTRRNKAFVDIDETLVKTKILQSETSNAPPGFTKFTVQLGDRVVHAATMVRPSARAFLERLNELYEVHALTSGGHDFQHHVLSLVGLRHLVGTIYYGRQDSLIVEDGDKFVLVDDLPISSSGMEWKMGRLGYSSDELRDQSHLNLGPKWQAVIDRHVASCKLFLGEDDEQPLTELLEDIARKFDAQDAPLVFDT